MTVLCEDCDNVEADSRKREWYRWLCLQSPKPVPFQFVVKEPFLTEPPFRFCKYVNQAGECEKFETRKENTDVHHADERRG